jgi:hypothetical protein
MIISPEFSTRVEIRIWVANGRTERGCEMTAVFDRDIDQWDEDGMCFRILNHRGNQAPWAMNLIGARQAELITWELSQAVYSYENNYFNQ